MPKKIAFILILFLFVGINSLFAQEKITQKAFAVRLVKEMQLDSFLPIAPDSTDCVELLDNLGISPIKGWNPNSYLTNDDYTVIIAKAVGKESVVYKQAALVCQKNIEMINKRWQDSFNALKSKWISLNELLTNKTYFPLGKPQCPFGLIYEDKDNDHKVDAHYHPTAIPTRLKLLLQD